MRHKIRYIKSLLVLFCIIMFYGCSGVSKDPVQSGDENKISNKNLKLAALTFDDGPYGDATKQVLDILKTKDVKATFFVMGMRAEQYPDLLKREVAEGHIHRQP